MLFIGVYKISNDLSGVKVGLIPTDYPTLLLDYQNLGSARRSPLGLNPPSYIRPKAHTIKPLITNNFIAKLN